MLCSPDSQAAAEGAGSSSSMHLAVPQHTPGALFYAQVDEIIERLIDVRNGRPGKQVQLAEQEIRLLCLTAKEIFMSQPNLLELEAPIKICGRFWTSLGSWGGAAVLWYRCSGVDGFRRRHPRPVL